MANPIIRGNSLYTLTPTQKDWRSAENDALAMGGHLVNIGSKAENDFIVSGFSGAIADNSYFKHYQVKDIVTAHIGLSHSINTSIYATSWTNSQDEGYRNLGEGWWVDRFYNTFSQIILNNGGTGWGPWEYNGYNSPDATVGKWIEYNQRYGEAPQANGIAEIPLTSSITFSSAPKEGAGVFTTSINLSAGTQTTGNLAEGAQVWWKLSGITAEDLASGALTGTGTITNGKLDVQHSLKVDADTGEKFEVSVYSDADRTQQIGTTKGSAVLEASVVRGNSLYTIVDGPSWTQAEANSVKLGGHLTAINDKQENDWIASEFSKDRYDYPGDQNPWDPPSWHHLYLGGLQENGAWKWSNGEKWWDNFRTEWVDPSRTDTPVLSGLFNVYLRGQYYLGDGQGTFVWYPIPDLTQSVILAQNNDGKGIAETSFIRRGDSAYVIVQGPTWEEAEANAVKLGGHLVTINDAVENDWILENIKNLGVEGNTGDAFIGLKRFGGSDPVGDWRWTSGEASTYTNWYYDPTWGYEQRPNITNNPGATVGMIYLDYPGRQVGKGFWNDTQNDVISFGKGIAEIKLAPNNTPTGTPNLSGTLKAGQVITIDKSPVQDADNFTGYTPVYNYSFEVSNDNGTTWTNLTTTDATDNNTTYTLTTAEVGKKVRGVVSYLDGYGTNEVVASAGSSVITAPVVRGNSLYTIVDGPSWTQAEANSVKLGGHLVTINDAGENLFLVSKYASPPLTQTDINSFIPGVTKNIQLWTGYTDSEQEGNWKWISNEQSLFTNWRPGEPDENLTAVIPGGEDYASFLLYENGFASPGQWADISDVAAGGGIAETPFIRRGDSAYVIVQGPTWEEAEANAVKLGGHLVTINDAAENDWVTSLLVSSPDFGVWIGVNDKKQEGSYVTPIDENQAYFNWVPREPQDNGGEDYVMLYTGNTSDTSAYHRGKWNDLPINFDRVSKGIAEIKLAPNSTPTGTPTLSGTTKVGQVISIDKTPLQDVDNFTGYTPTYNYSFEVSNDNGTTWIKLTSTDATDNNNTYTLTTAEVGKKIRGVVSYLDGYGTIESVASAGSTNVLAPSNTVPTALQTLRGSSKVGRVLTADKSTIIDPDGVPTSLSYRWEVSTNGTTWTTLTSADATDNNSTYALTAAELGKTVRSVISYTDNFGTNEVVNSAPTIAVVANAKPTSISLSTSSIAENIGANKAVATLRSVDVDTDDAYTYALVSGTGSTDNSRFTIAGDKLTIISNPDFETKNSYSIRVRTKDSVGAFIDKTFVVKITNVNEAPTIITLSNSDLLENTAAGSVIGNLSSVDPDKETTFTYSLTPNSALATFADNQFFSIVNDQLKINASANFEQKDYYTISVRSTDAGKLFYDQILTMVVQDEDEAPTNISITGTGINENSVVGSVVGELITTDQDESSAEFEYELIAGATANNNDLFEIVGDQLKSKAPFNFETKSSYVVNVRTTDEVGLTFDKSITIKVNNVNENPTDLTVSATAFNENVAIGTTVSTLGVLDPDTTGTYTYSLVSGVGDNDNQAFLIAGNALKVNVATNFEIQKTYSVRLRVTDQGGLFFEKSVALGVNNLIEKVSSAVSTTLVPDKDTLELTGTRNIAGIGNQFDNTITGNTGKNKLTGGLGKDTLKGGAGVDTFFYNDLKESLLTGFDVITDFAAGERINIGTSLFEGDDLINSTGKASALNEGAISSVLTNTTFFANNAAAFTVEGLTGTFLALNDGRDGFQADSDALIHLSKYTIGSTTPISII